MSRSRSSKGLPKFLIVGLILVAIGAISVAVWMQPVPVKLTIDPIGKQTVNELETVMVKAVAHVEGVPVNTLRYRIVSGPKGATINSRTGKFSWKPAESQAKKTHKVEIGVQATGATMATASTKFSIVVNAINEPPVLFDEGDLTVAAGEPLTFVIRAVDPDQPPEPLEFRFGTYSPQGARLDPLTGAFEWTPPASAKEHDENFEVTVTDAGGLKVSKKFKIHVTAKK